MLPGRRLGGMRGTWLIAILAALATACASEPAASPSLVPPTSPPAAPVSGLPLGCHPIDLRDPTGERIDLTGEWTGSGILAGDQERAWLNQIGDCVYGSVMGGEFLGEPGPGATITNLSGRIGADFRIEADIAIVLQEAQFAFGEYSTMEMVIEWDADGRIRLREDREPGERASRCVIATFECPAPVIWYRVDEPPPS